MRFKGHLLLPNETGPGLQVNLDVAAHHLAVESESGGLGAWPLEVVDVRRLQGDVFAMTVAGEDLHFVAEDALSFAYSGLPAIGRVSTVRSRTGLRNWFSKMWHEEPQRPAQPFKPEAVEDLVGETPADSVLVDETAPETRLELEDDDDDLDMVRVVDMTNATVVTEGVEEDPFAVEPWISEEKAARETVTSGCRARRTDGQPCQSPIVASSGYCIAHDPHRTVADGYRAAHEARARLKAQSTARLNRVYSRLDKAMRQVERGELDPEIAMAMAQLAQTMCAILDLDDEPDDGPRGPARSSF